MPKVNTVNKARKAYPEHGIKKGDTYYWWKFRFGGKVMSKSYPKASQLTQSEFLSTVYGIVEQLEMLDGSDITESRLEDIIMDLETLRDETQDKFENMPEQLQDTSEAGNLLQERVEALENMIDALQSVDLDIDESVFEYTCPHCGEVLDEEQIEKGKCPECKEEISTEDYEEQKLVQHSEREEEILSEIQDITYEGS